VPITRTDETELLTALHEGILEEQPWSTFLARLRRRLAADDASLLIGRGAPAGGPTVPYLAPLHVPAGQSRPLFEALYRLDATPFHRLRPGRVYAQDSFLDESTGAGAPPADERSFAAMAGRHGYLRILRVTEPDGANAWIALSRRARDFDAGDGALLSALASHLIIALRNHVAVQKLRHHSRLSSHALARLGFGSLTLDARGVVLERDALADGLLKPLQSLWRTHDGRLRIVDPSEAGLPQAEDLVRAIALSADPHLELLLVPQVDPAVAALTGVASIGFVHGAQAQATNFAPLMSLFGLSAQEARLALALTQGKSIVEAAAILELTGETARNYSKRIYAKTGTRGQADLVRTILTSVASLA
jgi:DNA-binding CsgD family transcriptional regulator